MVRSMICHSNLPESLWAEALKIAAYILNRVPTKVAAKTHIFMYGDVQLRPDLISQMKGNWTPEQ